ncbi:MAG: Ig-like domain-containing protein [Gemmatimonadaceae bacterium]
MAPPTAAAPRSSPLRRFALSGAALLVVLVVLLSCMGDTATGPKKSGITYASGLRFNTVFPAAFQSAFAGVVNFDRVRILIRRRDASVALDTIINFPATVDQITLELNVPISPGASATGEDLIVSLGYLNTANDTVFKGTKQITATPSLPGQPAQAPVTIDVVYTGPGASATAVRISPRQVSVNGGGPFTFTAVGVDGSGAPIPNTPIAWSSLDALRATITSPSAGSGVALNQRGTARIVASLITGKTDTVLVDVTLPPSAITVVSGNGQVGLIGKPTLRPFAQPLVVKVAAADGLGASGVTVNFAAASGGGSVSPASAVTDANGLAQTSWTPGTTAGPQTATATTVGLTGSPLTFTGTTSQTIATQLVFTSAPVAGASADAQSALGLVVAAQDVDGDVVTSFTGTVVLSIGTGPVGAALTGPTTVAAVAGVATFTNIGLALPATGYILNAATAGLTTAATPAFNIVNGAPASITVVSGGGQTAAVNAALSPIIVLVKDAAGNASVGATVDFAVATGGGSVTPATTTTDNSGQASATWTLGAASGAQTLTAAIAGVTPVTVSATATTSATSNQVVVTQSPGTTQTAGATVVQPLIAEVRNSSGALLSTYTGTVTIAFAANPGSATLAGTTTVAAVGGIATFSNFSINKAASGYTLVVSTPGASNATSAAFSVAPAAPSVLVLQSGGGQSGQPNSALAAAILVRVDDAFGNGVDNVQLNFAVTAGGGNITTVAAVTANGGTAFTNWTLGPSGTQTLTITSPALPNSPLPVSATFGAGAPATTVVSPQRDTITAFTDTRQLTAQGRDAAGNLVAGTWTWVSRTPSVATVSASGVVTSVVDGSSYIVATEAGGSKDSSLIVVQQRVATVNVNPSARSIYNGATFPFTAQAVDGRGIAIVTQPTITWTSSVPSVATVNGTSGVATGVGLGSTQIRATAGTTVGVSNLTVLTPITRIDVSYDTTNAPAPDVFTMTSLGDRRIYKAVARDTLLNVIPNITFTWNSTNASVALIDSTTPVKARATAAANGVTSIQASAQGVTGAATLNVAQVLSSIDLGPLTVTIGVTGSTPMLARGKDANGRYIAGGTFTYASSAPAVATVTASTGVVTGVANGQASITAASGTITSNPASVFVNGSGPAIISFGRDTLGIGRGTSTAFPILLSKPSTSAVIVNLAVADTFAFWTSASVTVPAGQTSVNATLTGRNAGTTKVYAVDGGSTLYAGDTAVLAVQANLRMTTSSYSLVANDQIVTQALLSDPSPAGGTYVTFTYGTAGKALVSPDPAFIPAGQLAADVVIRGLAQGNTTITPSASGVTGTQAFVNIGAATLFFQQFATRLGEGQYDPNSYVRSPNTLFSPLAVTLTSQDTTILRATPPTVTIPAGGSTATFTMNAVGRGTSKILGTAPGWTPDTMTVVVTTPMVTICCNTTLNTTSAAQSFSVTSTDSLRTQHPRTSSLVARVSSSDTTVIKVIDTLVTINAGASQRQGQVIPGGLGGTAYVKVTASGHTPDSVRYTVVGPALTLSFTSLRLGAGQEEGASGNYYVQIPNATGNPLVITLTSSDSSIAASAQTVTIPANGSVQYLTLRGKNPGVATIVATAQGYSPDTATITVTTPHLLISGGNSVSQFSTSSTTVYAADSVNSIHYRTSPLTVTMISTDTTILSVDSVLTMAAGQQRVTPTIRGLSPGTVKIIATAPGHVPDTATWTVLPAKLTLSWSNFFIGAHQRRPALDQYVQTPATRGVVVPVTFTQKHPNLVGMSSSTVNIPANSNIVYFSFAGLATGRDTIIASAPGYLPDTAFVTVTTPILRQQSLPTTATTTSPPTTMTVYVADSLSQIHLAGDTVVVRAVSSDTSVIQLTQPYYSVLKGSNLTNPVVIYVGVGTANITFSDTMGFYRPVTTNNVTVTGPSLQLVSQTGTYALGMRQQSTQNEYLVYRPNSSPTPLTVNLLSTDPNVATVPASVTIPANATQVAFRVVAHDTLGTIQLQATASGYALGTASIRVTQPTFTVSVVSTMNTTAPAQAVTVYARDALGYTHEVAQDVAVSLSSSAPGVVSIDSSIVTIPAGQNYSQGAKMRPGAVGTAVITAFDARPQTVFYRYLSGTANVNVTTPLSFLNFTNMTLGVGQYDPNASISLSDIATSPTTVLFGHAASPHTNTVSSLVVATGQYTGTFRVTGTSIGSDTITASPTGHVPDLGEVKVTLGRIDPISGWPSTLRAGDSVRVTLFTRDANTSPRLVVAATTFTLAPNANIQFVSGGQGSVPITSVTVPADASSVAFYIKGVAAGSGGATITSTNYVTYTNTLTVTP